MNRIISLNVEIVLAAFLLAGWASTAHAGGRGLPTCNDLKGCFPSTTLTCTTTNPSSLSSAASISDAGNTIFSDGLGSYVDSMNDVESHLGQWANLWANYSSKRQMMGNRSINFDLSNPVPGGGGINLGIINDPSGEIHVQWKTENGVTSSLYDIPVGATVLSDQANLGVHIGGVIHVLQVGPTPKGSCYAGTTAVRGDGTSQLSVTRLDNSTWVIDAPSGSIGRLFDDHNTDTYAVDKGLYYFALHVVYSLK